MPSWSKLRLDLTFPMSYPVLLEFRSLHKYCQAEASRDSYAGRLLCSSMRLPPEIAAILCACRYSEVCTFKLRDLGCHQVHGAAICSSGLRSPAGRWMETCRWVRVLPRQDQVGSSCDQQGAGEHCTSSGTRCTGVALWVSLPACKNCGPNKVYAAKKVFRRSS